MGKVNNVVNWYFRDKTRFADLFNGVFFQGEEVIKPEVLTDSGEVYEGDRERVRDVKMKMVNGEILRFLALENQNLVDYTMPLRCMEYDALEYLRQLAELKKKNGEKSGFKTAEERLCKMRKSDRLIPVYTLCFYHGEANWDGPRTLKDMMDFGSGEDVMKEFFVDYPFHLYCMNEENNCEKYHTELGLLFEMLKCRGNKMKLLELMEQKESYQHIGGETLKVASVMMNAPKIWNNRTKYIGREKEEFNMCQAIRELVEDGRQEGRQEGIMAFIQFCKEEMMEERKILNGIVKYFQISEENAKEYLQEAQIMVK